MKKPIHRFNRYSKLNNRFDLGGVASDAASGAAAGASIGSIFPGYGTLIGGVVGGLAGTAEGIIAGNKEDAAKAAAKQQAENMLRQQMYNASAKPQQVNYTPTFSIGGTTYNKNIPKFPYGTDNIKQDTDATSTTKPYVIPLPPQGNAVDQKTLDAMAEIAIKNGNNDIYAPQLPNIAPPKYISLQDNRKVNAATGKPINPNKDLISGKYDINQLDSLVKHAALQGLPLEDAKNIGAIGLRESHWNQPNVQDADKMNIGHAWDYYKPDEQYNPFSHVTNTLPPNQHAGIEATIAGYKDKVLNVGKKNYPNDTEAQLQVYNGKQKGSTTTSDNHYGKIIHDIRDNVMMKHPDVQNIYSKYYGKDGNPIKFAEGGKIDHSFILNNNDNTTTPMMKKPKHMAIGGTILGGAKINQPSDTSKPTLHPYQVVNQNNANAELEAGEPYRTPDGDMNMVTGKSHAEGGEQFNLPEGTEILGKNISSTGKSYKEEGEKITTQFNKYRKMLEGRPTAIVKTSAQKMMEKLQKQYSGLLSEQEQAKQAKMQQTQPAAGQPLQDPYQGQYAVGGTIPRYANGTDGTNDDPFTPHYDNFGAGWDAYAPQPQFQQQIDPNSLGIKSAGSGGYDASGNTYDSSGLKLPSTGNNFNYAGAASKIGSAAPVIFNMAQGLFGKAKQVDPNTFANPYANQAINMMQNRKYDVNPELEENKVATANYYHNLRGAAPSQSQYLAGLQSGQIQQQRNAANTYSKANNINNEYIGQTANMMGSLGQQRAQTNMAAYDMNTRAQSVQQSYLPTALTQLSQMIQMDQKMNGETANNAQMRQILQSLFKNYGMNMNQPNQ